MSLFDAINVGASGLTANRLWLDVIANNMANANTTRTANGEAYRRKVPLFTEALREVGFDSDPFSEAVEPEGAGVHAMGIASDTSPFKMVYNPGHPDADNQGFVKMPNVNIVNEMVDMISANRAYDAGVQLSNTAKAMMTKALEIGR